MKDWILSLLVWLILPALLLAIVIPFYFNIFWVIMLFTWLGFGAFMISPSSAETS